MNLGCSHVCDPTAAQARSIATASSFFVFPEKAVGKEGQQCIMAVSSFSVYQVLHFCPEEPPRQQDDGRSRQGTNKVVDAEDSPGFFCL